MDENLFDEQEGSKDEGAQDTGTQTAQGTEQRTDGGMAERLSQVEDSLASTNEALASLTRTLAQSVEQAAKQEGQASQSEGDDDYRQRLVNDPRGTIGDTAREIAERTTRELAGQEFTPVMASVIDATHRTLMKEHELQIRADFGDEAWDKVVEPAVRTDIETLRERNVRALADPAAVKALVDRQIGMNYKSLAAKQATHQKAKEQAMAEQISTGLPAGGQPRVRLNPDEADEDAKQFFSDIEKATGVKTNVKEFMKLHNTGNTIDDYLAVVGKEAK